MLSRAWDWRVVPARADPMSVTAFLLTVIAKKLLHNSTTKAFVEQSSVLSADIVFTATKYHFIGRVWSARKSRKEFRTFAARTALENRYVGVRPQNTTEGGRQWFDCLNPATVAILGPRHPSAFVPVVDAVQEAVDMFNS